MTFSAPKTDVNQKVTDTLIDFIEAGAGLCIPLWDRGPALRPLRSVGIPYTGVNSLVLMVEAMVNGYRAPMWGTMKQINALGGRIRKGEKGSLVVYADTFAKTETNDKGEDVERHIPFMKGYHVWNLAAQTDGLPGSYYAIPEFKLMDKPERLQAADAFIRNTGAVVLEEGFRAFYAPARDVIVMPPYELFKDRESFHAVQLHELGHWTSHPDRLNRNIGVDQHDPQRGREELVAEISSAFLCAALEISPIVREDHAAYLSSWLKLLRGDKRAIFRAAAEAQKAVDWLFAKQPSQTASEAHSAASPAL